MRSSDWSSTCALPICLSKHWSSFFGSNKDGHSTSSGRTDLGISLWLKAHGQPLRYCRGSAMSDRKSVVEVKRVSVRLDLGGRRIFEQKTDKPNAASALSAD